MASNAKNLAEYLNNETTSATADIADGSITGAKLANNLNYDSGTLFLDSSNNRVGVGTASPASPFHINLGTDKNLQFSGGIGEIGSVPGFQATNDAGSALTDFGIRANANMRFAIASNERFRITANGVTFNGDTAAANALSDYEEGTFNPTFNTTGGGDSWTYTSQDGYYLKIGAFVWVSMNVSWSNRSGGSGQFRMGNLPFAPASGSRRALAGMPYSSCFTGLSNAYNIQPHSNIVSASVGTYFWYTNGNGNIAAYLQSADLSSSGTLQTVLGYESSA